MAFITSMIMTFLTSLLFICLCATQYCSLYSFKGSVICLAYNILHSYFVWTAKKVAIYAALSSSLVGIWLWWTYKRVLLYFWCYFKIKKIFLSIDSKNHLHCFYNSFKSVVQSCFIVRPISKKKLNHFCRHWNLNW